MPVASAPRPTRDRPAQRVDPAGTGEELLFLPADPPRDGRFAWWSPRNDGRLGPSDDEVEVVVPTERSVRRRTVPVRTVPLARAIDELGQLRVDDRTPPGQRAWAAAVRFALDLVARGRLHPGITDDGHDTWRVGPLGRDDRDHLEALAAALPAAARALSVPGSTPLRVRDPLSLVADVLDAVADRLVRTSAAGLVATPDGRARIAGSVRSEPAARSEPSASRVDAPPAWATTEPVDVRRRRGWLRVAVAPTETTVGTALRLTLSDGPDGGFGATLQLTSPTDPSLVVDAEELWRAPQPVLARLCADAEAQTLLALRRAARLWPPLERLLDEARPSMLALSDEEAGELLGDVALALADVGMEVLWPTELGERPTLSAVLSTPALPGLAAGGLQLDALLAFRWEVAVGGQPLDAEEIAALAEAKRPLVRVRGRWVVADAELLARLRRPPAVHGRDALAAGLDGALVVDDEPVAVRVEGPLGDVVARLGSVGGAHEMDEPAGLDATLRPYQRRGVAWLTEMAELGLGGCLADDMGLGKTIQVIAHHLHRTTGDGAGPLLVVCPATLLANWEREIRRFAPALPVRRFHGPERTLDAVAGDEVVLATYGVARRDTAALSTVPWGTVVADEAQAIKNPLSRSARALREIPSPVRFALTGTPVENQLTDLWALADWTTPGLLGSMDEFRRTVALPIERDRDPIATERLGRLVRPFVLRRHKTDPEVAPDLPPKTELDRIVPLTAEQVTLYEAVVRETLALIADAEGIARQGLVFKLLTSLKQICNHPVHHLGQKGPLTGRSGKLDALEDLLDVVVAEGDSALVFTQYTKMGRLLERHLEARGITAAFLHGRQTLKARQTLVDRFQAGELPVLLVSLKAGGTGLNLTRATHVVHYDRWWNPAVEDQASDRAWRIGQTRAVTVHRLITEGTVEDRVAELLRRKRALADAVVGSGEAWIGDLSDGELRALVALDGAAA